jgi:hypothetical protein
MAGVEKNSRRACSLESRVTRMAKFRHLGIFSQKLAQKLRVPT